ncbi:MAG: PAS domain S-box protein [Ectothiorhodospiraceae bacterium]|nr:PAS domain S-box protein [Ectothiorhodospiraceae bacterium]
MEKDIQHTPPPQPCPPKRNRRDLLPVLLVLGGLLMAAVVGYTLWQVDQHQHSRNFQEQLRDPMDGIGRTLEQVLTLTDQFGYLMGAATGDRGPLFEQLARTSLDRRPYLELVAWVEVDGGPAEALDNAVLSLGAYRSDGELLAIRSELPLVTETHQDAMRRSVERRKVTAADGPVLLPGTDGLRPGQMFFRPVFDQEGETLDGLVVVALRFDGLTGEPLNGRDAQLHLFDHSRESGNRLPLYSGPGISSSEASRVTESQLRNRPSLRRELNVADQLWVAWLVPDADAGTTVQWSRWAPLGLLALLMVLSAIALHERGRETQRVTARFIEREQLLSDLRRRNEKLNTQLKQRIPAETIADQPFSVLRSSDARDMFSRHDQEGITLAISSSCESLLGYKADELEGRNIYDFLDPRYRERIRRKQGAKLAPGESFTAAHPVRHKNGRLIWLESNHWLVTNAEGEQEVLVLSRDISHRRQAEQQLRHSELLYRSAFEHAATGIALFDPHTGRCLQTNRALCELLGYSSAELVGMDFRDITHPADANITPPLVRGALRGGDSSFRVEKRYLRKDGGVVSCLVHGALLRNDEGTALALVIHIQQL